MSNNSFVTLEGGEMGRAQVVQAKAAGKEPSVHMNPVLLKPEGNSRSQVILQGQVWDTLQARDYFKRTESLFEKAMESLEFLISNHDWTILEGAGSCGEVNLRNRDIVNFRPAHHSNASVILVADIEKGGVFAQIIGTLEVISSEDRARIKGLIINKFRGDPTLFSDGIKWIEKKTGIPVLAVIPYFENIMIEPEDSLSLSKTTKLPKNNQTIKIAVIQLPYISNHTDFMPLEYNPNVELSFLKNTTSLNNFDLVLLPGSKNVCLDMKWLQDNKWDSSLKIYANNKGQIGGICGGYQLLGERILDPEHLEGNISEIDGLKLLPIETTLHSKKTLKRTEGIWNSLDQPVRGYEIHCGQSRFTSIYCQSTIHLSQRSIPTANEGCLSKDLNIWGSYLHGLFDSGPFIQAFLHAIKPEFEIDQQDLFEDFQVITNREFDKLADFFEKHLAMEKLESILKS